MKFCKIGIMIAILTAALTGCESESSNNSAISDDIYTESGYPIFKDGSDVSISFFAPLRPKVSTYDSSINPTTAHMESKIGFNMEFVECNEFERQQKFNIMMTGGDYTDVILEAHNSLSELALYGQQGIFIPLEDLIKEHAPNIQAVLDSHPEVTDTWTLENGHLYTIPRIGNSTHSEVPYRMWLNKKWLDNLDLEVPTTTEEFFNVLLAFKEKDANGNGDPNDEVPLSGAMTTGWNINPIPFLANAFIPCAPISDYLNVDENGTVYYAKATNEWKEFLKYMNRLYEAGVIDPLMLSQTDDQVQKLGSHPAGTILGATAGGSVSVFTNTTNFDTWTQYIVLPPLEGPAGVRSAARNPDYGQATLSITNKCPYPEAVIRWADYMFTEEALIWSQFGQIGNARIQLAPDDSLNIIGGPAKYTRLPADNAQDVCWNRVGPDYRPPDYDLWFTAKENPVEDIEKVLYESAVNHYLPCVPEISSLMPKVEFSLEESRTVIDALTNINLYVDQITAEFITGIKDVDSGWNDYLNMLDKNGLQEYLAVNQTAYDRN
ncbi:MAG: hypothetical protein ATN31_06295 [Candidatus Epulonipiscioides saccharophilum]|nr:MAG: hypothetical protein ATN31_06295 [Epulopiscium sp. AS2M-Bin001]